MSKNVKKGSFTIEAAIIVPITLLMMVTVMRYGINLYQQSVERKLLEALEEWDAVESFYEMESLKKLEEEMQND